MILCVELSICSAAAALRRACRFRRATRLPLLPCNSVSTSYVIGHHLYALCVLFLAAGVPTSLRGLGGDEGRRPGRCCAEGSEPGASGWHEAPARLAARSLARLARGSGSSPAVKAIGNQYSTIQYNTIPYHTIPYNTMQYNAPQYNVASICNQYNMGFLRTSFLRERRRRS